MTAVLLGIGTATPPDELLQHDAAKIAARLMRSDARRTKAIGQLYEQSGVKSRRTHVATGGRTVFFDDKTLDGPTTGARVARFAALAPELASHASAGALARSGVNASDVTHLVTVSCTGFSAPGVDIALMRRLGLGPHVQRTHVGFMGCHGAINGLRVAAAIAQSEPGAIVLVCCVELCSLHFQYRPGSGGATANALFGDGAAACLIGGAGPGPALRGFGSVLLDRTGEDMGWVIGDHGFEMSLSARVPAMLEERVGVWVDHWLAAYGLTRDGVGSWAIHPGGPRIVEAVRRSLGLRPCSVDDSLEVLRTLGNMSSPTLLFVIDRMLASGAPFPLVGLAFGPGLAGEAVLLET
ncbi:MAG: type III polyketide synthase [Planctomycetota bacterium]